MRCGAFMVLNIFEEEALLDQAQRLGRFLRDDLDQLARTFREIGMVRGVGAMLALEFVKDGDPGQPDAAMAQRVVDLCREGGLLVIKCGLHRNSVRLLAPLNTSLEDARRAVTILSQAIANARSS